MVEEGNVWVGDVDKVVFLLIVYSVTASVSSLDRCFCTSENGSCGFFCNSFHQTGSVMLPSDNHHIIIRIKVHVPIKGNVPKLT